MAKKTCESWLCSNTCNAKYRYCYSCAKRKGLIGDGGSGWGTIIFVLILLFIFF